VHVQVCLRRGDVMIVSCPHWYTPLRSGTQWFKVVHCAYHCVVLVQVCLRRGDVMIVSCTQWYTPTLGDTCDSIMSTLAQPPLSPSAFFALNPGLMCPNLIPGGTEDGPLVYGQQVCLPFPAGKTEGVNSACR